MGLSAPKRSGERVQARLLRWALSSA
jgi:hypothetical protein